MTVSRRTLIKQVAQTSVALGVASSLGGCGGAGTLKIDVHHHAVPAFYVDALADIGITRSGGISFPEWTPEKSLNVLAFNQITAAVLSLSSPGSFFGDPAFAIALARKVNDFLADLVQQHPTRFGFFATLPMPLTAAAAGEAEYALDVLAADGVCLLASSDGVFLGDPALDEVLSVLNTRKATVFIHPNQHPTSRQLGLTVPSFAVEFVIDTTRAVSNMIWNGTFEKFPDIRWILAHAGGTLPFIAWRLSLLDLQFPELRQRSPRGTMSYLKRLYYDTALSPSANSLFPLLNQFGSEQILFGTDYPFAPAPLVPLEMVELNRSNLLLPTLDSSALDQIYARGFDLFPRLRRLHLVETEGLR